MPYGQTDGKTDGWKDGQRQNNIPPPMAGENKSCQRTGVVIYKMIFQKPFAHLRGTNPKTSPEQSAIFQLVQEINKTNVLTKFRDDWAKNREIMEEYESNANQYYQLTNHLKIVIRIQRSPVDNGHFAEFRKTAQPPWQPYIYKTNLFTKLHGDWAKNVTSRVKLPRPPPPGSHETNVLTTFHEKWAKNVTSRVFTCFHYIHFEKNAPPTGGHVFSLIWTIFKLIREINKTNVLTNFHDDWAKIVTSRVFTRKTAPPTGGHVFLRTRTTFQLNQHIIKKDENQSREIYRNMHYVENIKNELSLYSLCILSDRPYKHFILGQIAGGAMAHQPYI
ncbi:hypothetical protein DPMN_074650 [Dreissena polymorpha]|uniref:Uncharacterized protein n=1 Tax=Dreissena polymorpha TaxID=45954 RepID=A0A9D4BE84_DREPO|nr:hypothetical protein DPMN_074650 [Dreissena polymorpha]